MGRYFFVRWKQKRPQGNADPYDGYILEYTDPLSGATLRHHELPHTDAVPGQETSSTDTRADDLSCGDWGRMVRIDKADAVEFAWGAKDNVHCAAMALASALKHLADRAAVLFSSRTCRCSKRSTCIAKWETERKVHETFHRYFSVGAVHSLWSCTNGLDRRSRPRQTLADLKAAAQAKVLLSSARARLRRNIPPVNDKLEQMLGIKIPITSRFLNHLAAKEVASRRAGKPIADLWTAARRRS